MGLFSRNEPAAKPERRSGSRSSVSSEAQADELRGRARRRLIGALALVVAAVIVVPMLFDTPPKPDQVQTPVVVPAAIPPVPAPNTAVADATAPGSATDSADAESPLPTPDSTDSDADAATGTEPLDTQPDTQAAAPAEPQKPETKPGKKPKPESKPPAEHQTRANEQKSSDQKSDTKAGGVQRTDDGSVALALLQGRKPADTSSASASESKAPADGKYVLQIAAYTTDKDAQVRRDRLIAAGVTNAYIQSAVSSGKPTYRLRVGPFPTREAAQAAQARLRALGYDNGFISSK